MPPSLRLTAVETLGGKQFSLRFEQSRYATTLTGLGLWIVKGRSVTCLFQESATVASCAPHVFAAHHGMLLEMGKPGNMPTHFLMLGVVPIWASVVHLRTGGKSRTVAIKKQIFAYRSKNPINVARISRR
jgi:hypothetical protein